jgi:hypothetical protein
VEDHKIPDFFPNLIVPNPLFKELPKQTKIIKVEKKKTTGKKKTIQENKKPVDFVNRHQKKNVKKKKTK